MPMPSSQSARHAVLRLEYDGTPYHGWTRQPHGFRTVEGDLLAAFAALDCSGVQLRCAGRTDAGVHARAQVVDARYEGSVPEAALARALSGSLPTELVVHAAGVAPVGFDARADATSRAYEYRLLTGASRSPLRAQRTFHHPRTLDRAALAATAAAVLGQHRFSAFTPSRTSHRWFDRRILESCWIERGDELVYRIRSTSFLRHMVRIIVGTMLAVGRGERSAAEFAALLAGAPRSDAFATAPSQGLCLVDVTWEPLDGVPTPPRWRALRSEESWAALPFSTVG